MDVGIGFEISSALGFVAVLATMRHFRRALALCLLCWGVPLAAEDSSSNDGGAIIKSLRVAEATRDNWSERWVDFAENIDRYLSGKAEDQALLEKNDSYLKLQLRQSFFKAGQQESDIRIRAKVDLPNTENRLKLFFSSDQDNESDLIRRTSSQASGEKFERESSVTGLEFMPDSEWHRWKRSIRVGVRLRSELVPYARLRLQRKFSDKGEWRRVFNQELSYFHDRGWEEVSELTFTRELAGRRKFSYLTSLEFQDQNNYFSNLHLWVLHKKMNDRWSRDFRAGSIFTSRAGGQAQRVFTGLNFYKTVHKDWVFLTLSPELFADRGNRWKPDYALSLRADVYFAD